MSDYFLGEIRAFSFKFAPSGWALCNGAAMTITQNQALYSLLGLQFGGDAKVNFLLPDLRGRAPLHHSSAQATFGIGACTQGNTGGAESVAITVDQMGAHNHGFTVCTAPSATKNPATGNLYAPVSGGPPESIFAAPTNQASLVTLATVTGSNGASAGHSNMQPFLVLNFCISLTGLYPSRS